MVADITALTKKFEWKFITNIEIGMPLFSKIE
jgi:hypothetical protein